MGLDLFVMPLWRYRAGRFEGPMEALGAQRIGSAKPDDPEQAAKEWAGRVRSEVERRVATPMTWADEGETALSLQYTYAGLHAIRAYAAYQDHPVDGGFKLDGSPDEHPSLMKIYFQNAPTRYRHLIDHSDAAGFYLPCEFDEPMAFREIVDVPPDRDSVWLRWFVMGALHVLSFALGLGKSLREDLRSGKEREKRIKALQRESPWPKPKEEPPLKVPRGKSIRDWGKVGSSVRLLRELDELNQGLGMTRDWGDLKSGEPMAPDGDPLDLVKYGWGVLHYVARVSVEKRLPIIFDG